MQPKFDVMPAELRALPRWVLWKGPKVPYCATLTNSTASVTGPDTWAPFPAAQTAFEEGGYSGVGFVLNGDGIVGVDLDKCAPDGVPSSDSMDLMQRIGCQYIELSPSGTGLRGFGYGDNIKGRRGVLDGLNVELYSSQRYLTVTGHALKNGPLVPLPGFAGVADAIKTPDLQKSTEDDRRHPLCSSVLFCRDYLPQQEGQRNKCLFALARHVKGTNPTATRQELRAIAEHWHELALPVIGTKDFATTWADFLRGWDKVRQPHGATLQSIIGTVDSAAPLPHGIAALSYGERGNQLVRICIALQAHHGEEPFFISARQAGELLGLHFTDASKLLAAMVLDGVLELVSKGAGKVASRYRFTWAHS
jgi:hypothetical protein